MSMTSRICAVALAATLAIAPAASAQSGKKMTDAQLTKLTSNGLTLYLGGEGMGYQGKLVLTKEGKGKGGATTDTGDKIAISGTWEIRDGKFCRTWAKLDGGSEVCETWYLTSGNAVEVYNGKKMLGVNSW